MAVLIHINSDINDHGPFLDVAFVYHSGAACTGYQNLSPAADILQFHSLCMADRHSGIILQKQHGQGASDDHAPADHHRSFTCHGNIIQLQYIHDCFRGTWSKTGAVPAEYLCNING